MTKICSTSIASAGSAVAQPRHRARTSRRTLRAGPRAAQRVDLGSGAVAVAPSRARPRGIVHFLGGAFVSAAPYLAYSALIDRIADSGYTVIATPYAVTFQHERCARSAATALAIALDELRTDRRTAWTAPTDAPLHGIGHSNGALIHAMIGSLGVVPPRLASNILISFNNRQVAEAVPLPLDPLAAVLNPVRGNGRLEGVARAAVGGALAAAEGVAGGDALRLLRDLAPAAVQLGSVFDEVGDGAQDFTPTPEENRRLFAASYTAPATLLLRFSDDTIDQTSVLEGALRARGAAMRAEELPGNHLTPVGPSAAAPVPGAFGPAEAVAQAALSLSQADLRRVGQRAVAWMDERGAGGGGRALAGAALPL